MDMLASCLEETFIRGFLHQSVLEAIGRFGWEAAAEHQPGRDELVEPRCELRPRKFCGRGQKDVGKLSSYHRADLCHLLGRR